MLFQQIDPAIGQLQPHRNVRIGLAEGDIHTPKQLQLDKRNGNLYWCGREGMRVMRCKLDGSGIETLVRSGSADADRGDQTKWCVGIAIDAVRPDNGERGRIFRAGIDIPAGESAAARSDIKLLYDGLPEPIDLEIDHDGIVSV